MSNSSAETAEGDEAREVAGEEDAAVAHPERETATRASVTAPVAREENDVVGMRRTLRMSPCP
jgi:hypothetical protein